MATFDPQLARQFAVQVVRRLRDAGFAALWAGGCVRDQLLGLSPKDYDVATNARPEQIREVFGRRRTLPIGQAFGVITVLGPPGAGQIEVATFRRDLGYSDGRRPDQVAFCDAQEDALRRDFTINGMFFDPLDARVVDYVGGQEDLQRGLIRAIGDPAARFAEDKLRMLRAVRFAATFHFALDPDTLTAIQDHAPEIVQVSAERISMELRRMLVDRHRVRAVELLVYSGLMPVILPELTGFVPATPQAEPSEVWQTSLAILRRLQTAHFPVALAVLLRAVFGGPSRRAADLELLCRRMKLTLAEHKEVEFLLRHEAAIRAARGIPWPQLQRILVQPGAADLVHYGQAVAEVLDGHTEDIAYAAQRLALPPEQLDPPPLIRGDDLRRAGLAAGPVYRRILDGVRDAQLDGQIYSVPQALDLARRLAEAGEEGSG